MLKAADNIPEYIHIISKKQSKQKILSFALNNSMVGYKSQVRSDQPIIFLPIINFIFVILSKL